MKFPVFCEGKEIEKFNFFQFRNTFNLYDLLWISIQLPRFLSLYRADTICPAPKMPIIDLGYFKNKERSVEVIIQATAMLHETALEDYYLYFAQINDEKLINYRFINNDRDSVDLLTIKKFEDGSNWITRKFGYKTWMGKGVYVITLNMSCIEEIYSNYASLFLFMLNSFELLKPPKYKLAEKLKIISRKLPVDFTSYIPVSWQFDENKIETIDEFKILFKRKIRGKSIGAIRVCSLKLDRKIKTIHEKVILEQFFPEYLKMGLDQHELNLRPVQSDLKFSKTYIGECDLKSKESSLANSLSTLIFLAINGSKCLYIQAIGPSKELDFEGWAVTRRGWELVKDNLRVL